MLWWQKRAQSSIAAGTTWRDRTPCIKIENAAVLTFAKLIAQLKLDGDGRASIPVPGARSHKRGKGHLYVAS